MTDLDTYLERVAAQLRTTLGDDVVAVYLHGSAAMDAFVPTRSDVDILVIASRSLSRHAKAVLAETLPKIPCPGVALELSVVTSESARIPADPPAFELHLNTQGDCVVDGEGGPGDTDLVAHFAMAREHGVAILGPPPKDLIGPIERSRLLQTLADDLAWSVEVQAGTYGVLNACRALRFEREGVLCTKIEGGEWAIEHGVADAELVASALGYQRGAGGNVDGSKAATLAEWVRQELLDAANS